MPRQIDLFSQNLQVTNDPNNQISVTAAQINNLKDQIPAALAAAEKLFLDNVLAAIDQATGLDLVDWLADAQAFFNSISASLQQSWLNLQNFFNGLAQEADADVTLALQWLQGQFNQLQALLQQSWLNFQQFLNGIVQDVDADVASAVAWLQGVGSAANNALTLLEDFLATGDWSDLSAAYTDLVQAIFGTSTSLGLVGAIPAPAVVDVVQSLQPVWDFPDAASVSAGGQWSWDGTEDHTGTTGSGSAKCVADGTLQGLRGIPGAVQPAQVVTATAWVSWSGLATTGSDQIQLQLIPYSTSGTELVAGTPFEVAQVASPGASGSWTELTGTYTVPSSGVDAVQLRLVVTADATAGSVWFDDCSADVSGGFLADLKADTNSIIDSFAPGGTVGEFQAGVTNLLALFGLTPADVGGATAIDSVWTTVVNDIINPLNAIETQAANIIGDIEQSAITGLTDVWDWLTGTPTPTSSTKVLAASVEDVLGGANLGADVASTSTNVTNTWGWLFGTSTPTSDNQLSIGVVPGVQGITDIATTIQNTWDNWANTIATALGLTGVAGSGNSLSDVTGAVQGHAQATSTALTTAQTAAMVQAQQTAAKAAYAAFGDVTADVTFHAGSTYNLSSMPTITVTQSSSVIGYVTTSDNVDKLSVLFVAETVGTLTGVYINVYAVDSSGLCTNVVAGSNIVSEIGTLENLIYDDFASALAVTPAAMYAIEVMVTGTGSLMMMGLSPTWAPTNSITGPGAVGGSRSSPPTHDATGAGSFPTSNATSFSWSHVLGSSATGILIEFAATQAVSSVKVGGVAATLLGSKIMPSGGETTYIYGLLNPTTGTQTVTVTLSASGAVTGNSDSYSGVTSFGTATTNSGPAGTASVAVSSTSDQLAAAAIFDITSGGALTAFNKTTRWNGGSSWASYGVFGDAAGASTVNFSATAGTFWSAVGVSLIGTVSATPPSTFTPAASTTVPLFGLSSAGGSTNPVFAPETHVYNTAGTYTLTIPSWVKYVDRIPLGGGGGGGGGINGAGSNGASSTVTVGSSTITATGGVGGPGGTTTLANSYGQTPGNKTYLGTTYFGGTEVRYAYDGASPGGGGGAGYYSGLVGWGGDGGNWNADTYTLAGETSVSITIGAGGAPNTFGSPSYGAAPGAAGGAWVVFRQS
jgi:hypothetical protein